MKHYYSYIRVSTTRQGQSNTSLAEQREAIKRHAARHDLIIIEEFEEQETAAKQGRPVFARMIKALKARKAAGVIMHKIDRSARNLRDWADLGELIDSGVELHFANEGLDLQSRGGRLSADIQAVVAADYIRNLREEARKGFYGRLKQGVYPMPAPLGYTDQGAGKPKELDPVQSPLVRQAFELYASTQWSLLRLTEELYQLGLRNRNGRRVSVTTLADLLHNPFYTGVIRMKGSGEVFAGKHEPIVPRRLYDRVQAVFSGKAVEKQHQRQFLFRKQLNCARCGSRLIGEVQKGYTYYRCHEGACPQKTIREELVEGAFMETLRKLRFNGTELKCFRLEIERERMSENDVYAAHVKATELQHNQVRARLDKISEAYLDGVFDEQTYRQKKNSLTMEEAAIRERLENGDQKQAVLNYAAGILEQANNAYLSFESGIFDEKREVVRTITSNCFVSEKSVLIKPRFPFQLIAERQNMLDGGAKRSVHRTISSLLSKLYKYFLESN